MSRKIVVLFDANPLVRQKTGVGYYTDGLITALAKNPNLQLIGHYFKPRGHLPRLPQAENLSYSHNSWFTGQLAKGLRKFRLRLPWELLARRQADVLLFPDFTSWPSLFRTPKILTVHDLTFIDKPEYVQKRNLRYLRRYVKHDARRADLVLTISNFSKKRLVAEFGLAPQKVLAEPIPPPPPAKSVKPSGQPAGFILFIGTLEPRKNVSRLVEAYRLLPEATRAQHRLVLAGGQGWKAEEMASQIEQLRSQGENIVQTGYVSDEMRAALYKEAYLVVVPSIYEGFGMPILEAMSYKAPVVASDLAVFKEVAGDAALYFDPNSPQDIKKVIIKLLEDGNLRKIQVQKGSQQLEKYSWQTVADEIYQEIQKLSGETA